MVPFPIVAPQRDLSPFVALGSTTSVNTIVRRCMACQGCGLLNPLDIIWLMHQVKLTKVLRALTLNSSKASRVKPGGSEGTALIGKTVRLRSN
jgi:hypothetical protein